MYREVEFDSKLFKEEGCFEPVHVFSKKLQRVINVPCGHCLPCLRRRQAEWVARLVEHLRQFPNSSYFVTLTYSDENLPFDQDLGICVSKSDIKKFHRDLRKRFQQGFFIYETDSDLGKISESLDLPKDRPFKYYLTSEYSPIGRPHYHAVYYNLPEDRFLVSLLFESIWKKGIVRCYPASPASIGYITKYLVNSKVSEVYQEGKMIRPFSMMSKNLGISYIDRMYLYHVEDMPNRYSFSSFHGEKSVLPRYWRDRIFPEVFRDQMFSRFIQIRDKIENRIDSAIKSSEDLDRYSRARQKFIDDQYYAVAHLAAKKQILK